MAHAVGCHSATSLFVLIRLGALCWLGACSGGSSKPSGSRGDGSAAGVMPDTVAVVGTLALDPSEAAGQDAAAAGKPVELVDDSGEVIATGTTDPAGAFTIALQTSQLGLLDDGTTARSAVPKLVRIRSLFLVGDGDESRALGVRQPIIIQNGDLKRDKDGGFGLDTGRHDAKAVGAIVGNVTLETNGDPTGVEVYVPGTTDIAKTDASGRFLLGFLPAGDYPLRADHDGFNSVEWNHVTVERQTTTHLAAAVMQIAKGPKIDAFALDSLDEETGSIVLRVKLRSATKYRISQFADFGDTEFKPVDATALEFSVPMSINAGVRVINVYLEAADSDGLSAAKTLVIDREAPFAGSIRVASGKTLLNSAVVALRLAARNATRMRIAESADDLASAAIVAFAEDYGYTIAADADGEKTLYAEFLDDAGNAIGSGGDISTAFTLDTTPPPFGALSLLSPASPTGAFNTPLAWQSTLDEPGMQYEVEVFDVSTYNGAPVRTMETASTSVNVTPPLELQGTYYWRIRAVDAAGNASDWVSSGADASFTLRVLAESYQVRHDYLGTPDTDLFLGRELAAIGDLTNDGIAEVAYSVMSTDIATCSDCGIVRVVDPVTRETLTTLTENLPKAYRYGQQVVACDVDGDDVDELVVAAPGARFRRGTYAYRGVGAVYVYETTGFTRIATLEPTVEGGDPAPGYYMCNTDPNSGSNVTVCGDFESYPDAYDGIGPAGGASNSANFGKHVSCARKNGKDHLLVGEPGHYDASMGYRRPRIGQYELSGSNVAQVRQIVSPFPNYQSFGFGNSFVYLDSFKYTGCTPGPTVALGMPDEYNTVQMTSGKVHLYTLAAGEWTECAAIVPTGSYTTWMQGFGGRLQNLGDIDADGTVEELAVSTQAFSAGLVRIYGGSAGALLKSIYVEGQAYGAFGYQVVPAGNFGTGARDIAITAPSAFVNGKPEAGVVYIYDLDDVDADDVGPDGPPIITLTGKPAGGALMGAGFVALTADGDMGAKPELMLVSTPGKKSGADAGNCVPPNCGNPGFNEPSGGIGEHAYIKLAPELPFKIVGESTKARMGAGLSGVPDIDGDGADDVIIGQPGGRCMGRPFGAVSLYSVLDGALTRSLCALQQGDEIGAPLLFLPGSGKVLFGNLKAQPADHAGVLYAVSPQDLLRFNDLAPMLGTDPSATPVDRFAVKDTVGVERPSVAVLYSNIAPGSGSDVVVAGDPDYESAVGTTGDNGRVRLFTVNASSTGNMSVDTTFIGTSIGDLLGASVASMPEISGSTAMALNELVIGVPGRETSGAVGEVLIMDRSWGGSPTTVGNEVYVLKQLKAKNALGAGVDAEDGFGSVVLGLPNFGTYDPTGTPFAADAYLYVANTNMAHGSDDAVPEYFIYAIDYVSAGNVQAKIVKHGKGTAGSMLGGHAKRLPDINGDGVDDLAIAYPGGPGQLGQTGQVMILSGKGLTTPDEADDLMQLLYNPEATAANFGTSIAYTDMTGDGLPDFVIGADEYDTSAYQDAGAVFVFRMAPVR